MALCWIDSIAKLIIGLKIALVIAVSTNHMIWSYPYSSCFGSKARVQFPSWPAKDELISKIVR